MTHLPKIAIVGRPNVGKSALFNRIVKKRIAIVEEEEGVTRDRLYGTSTLFSTPFEIIDTGGIEDNSDRPFNKEVIRQAELAIKEADCCIFVVDAQVGITQLDEQVAKKLHASNKPVVVAINKTDNPTMVTESFVFCSLGFDKMIHVSAAQNLHLAELLEEALACIKPSQTAEAIKSSDIKIALLGRPNVGKSTLLNILLNEERSCVSPLSGTTRDAIDATVIHNNQSYTFIDTAGIKRKKAEGSTVEKFAKIRTIDALERSDIALFLVDSTTGISTQDIKILNEIEKAGKACILLLNKWDLVKGVRMEHYFAQIKEEAPFLDYCPKVFISAANGRNLDKIFPLIHVVFEQSHRRISTAELNRTVEEAVMQNHPAMIKGRRLRIYYLSQVECAPPRFILFVNSASLMQTSYHRYLQNYLRQKFGFLGVPIKLFLKSKPPQKEKTKNSPAKPISERQKILID